MQYTRPTYPYQYQHKYVLIFKVLSKLIQKFWVQLQNL